MDYNSITIITDCACENAKGRQQTRWTSLFGITPTFIGVSEDLNSPIPEFQASGNLIDVLDSIIHQKGIVMVNVAPRSDNEWPNGTPFCYFYLDGNLIISTVAGYSLSLIKKLNLVEKVILTDIPQVMNQMADKGLINSELAESIINTQFRSFNYVPRLAKWLADGEEIIGEEYSISDVPDIGHRVWYGDCWGNLKTSILPEEIDFQDGKEFDLNGNKLRCYDRLKDVPDGGLALIIGSSGYGQRRFLEIVVNGGSASERLGMNAGELVETQNIASV